MSQTSPVSAPSLTPCLPTPYKRIGATTRCSVWRGPRCMEIAKCLILNDSLFPVIGITGNSGSLLAVSEAR